MSTPKQPNLFFKYGNIAIQMGAIIGLTTWGGQKLDERFKNELPIFTIILSLLGIAAALYISLKDIIKSKK